MHLCTFRGGGNGPYRKVYTDRSKFRVCFLSINLSIVKATMLIDSSHTSHNTLDKYPTRYHFATKMCVCVHVSVQNRALWDMGIGASWDLGYGFIRLALTDINFPFTGKKILLTWPGIIYIYIYIYRNRPLKLKQYRMSPRNSSQTEISQNRVCPQLISQLPNHCESLHRAWHSLSCARCESSTRVGNWKVQLIPL